MSQSSASTPFPAPSSPGSTAGGGAYQLSDDLARLCLPQEWKDSYRRLAWVNSVCFLFLVVGLVGLKAPRVVIRPLSELQEPVPVVFLPPEEQPKLEEVKPDEQEPPPDATVDAPQVVTVVAAADSANVAFAVPVQGAVAIAPAAHLATPPPPTTQAPPKPVQFNPAASHDGSYPPPMYPGIAQRNHYEGTVMIEILVDATGAITSAKVQKTSGFSVLDDAALSVVKNRWRFPPGAERWLIWPCIFKLER